jgi:hypothetical protein
MVSPISIQKIGDSPTWSHYSTTPTVLIFTNQSRPFDIEKIFTCDVYDLDTFSVTLLNGWFVYKSAPLTTL